MKPLPPLASSRFWHLCTMAEPSWLTPFFPPQKRHIADFLRTVNMGISTTPPSLVPLRQKTPLGSTSRNRTIPNNSMPSWTCPAVSLRSAGLACPVSLYGAKGIPPTRAERGQEPTIRQQRHVTGSGPNYQRLQQCIQCRNPPPAQAQALFKQPRLLQ